MCKAEKIARLALARAQARNVMVVIDTNRQDRTIALIWSIEPRAVLTLIGEDGVRVHQARWGAPRKSPAHKLDAHHLNSA